MRIALYLFMVFSVIACTENSAPTKEPEISYALNPLLGNAALESIPDEKRKTLSEVDMVKAHLSHVHDLLVTASASYPEPIRQKRLATLKLLANYIACGQFPTNAKCEGRRPCFIDANDSYCAVGHLVKETAGIALASLINAHHQYD